MSDTDLELLERYTRHRAEDAFAELVRRHLDLVFSAALRRVRSPHLAEEVAQSTFLSLAQGANRLSPNTLLAAWLYRVTHHTAANVVRREARRRAREQIALEMSALNATATDWTPLEPMLDDAMLALDETDRAAVLLRYFENKSFREVGQALGVSENAAQKRLTRAVDRLREFLAERGITVGASGLVAAVSTNAVQAAPVGLAASIATAAVALGGAALGTTSTTSTHAIAMTTFQKTVITATILAVTGTALYALHTASTLDGQLQALRAQRDFLAGQVEQSNREKEEALREADALRNRNPNETAELFRLRGEVSRLRRQVAGLGVDQPVPAAPPGQPDPGAAPPEPVRIFVANADARVPVGQTLAVGGWATASGKRTVLFLKPTIVDEFGNPATATDRGGGLRSILLSSQFIEVPDEVLDQAISDLNLPGMDRLKTIENATSSSSMLTAGEAELVLKTLRDAAGVDILSAPTVQTADGRQAVVSATENRAVAGQVHEFGPSLEVEPRIAADGSSVDMTVTARLRLPNSP